MSDIISEIKVAKSAALKLATMSTSVKDAALDAMAEALDKNRQRILDANATDMAIAENLKVSGKLTDALVKRLKVNDEKISGMIDGIRDVKRLKDPVGETMSALELDSGLMLYQIRCPIGMLGVIFESRPDVVPQILALCLKSGNGVAFKGGSEASNSNRALFEILSEAASRAGIPTEAFVLMETREDISQILGLHQYIDLLIPRGSNEFVQYIQNNTKIPVLGHAAGICHIYVDDAADIGLALRATLDSKIQYPAVCNAVETLLINERIAEAFLPRMAQLFADNGVEMRADERSKRILADTYDGVGSIVDAMDSDWDTEYNDLTISIKIVKDVEEAIGFINTHGSHHTDAIMSEDKTHQMSFVKSVDSADVFINASTRFADGYRYGKGAEVGISTNKIHSRGPVGMEGLMIYKYVLVGNGHVVKDYVGKDAKSYTHKQKDEDFRL